VVVSQEKHDSILETITRLTSSFVFSQLMTKFGSASLKFVILKMEADKYKSRDQGFLSNWYLFTTDK